MKNEWQIGFWERKSIPAWMLLALFVPLAPSLVPGAVALVVLVSLFEIKNWKWNRQQVGSQLPLVILFGMYFAGMIWTTHTELGWTSIERKLSLFLFPLLFLFLPVWEKRSIHAILLLFVFGVVLNSMASYAGGIQCYLESGSRDCMHSSALSFQLHPSYNAFYALMAMAILIHWLMHFKFYKGKQVLLYAGLLWLLVFVVLLASKAGLIGLILLVIYSFIRLVILSGRTIWLWIGSGGMVLLLTMTYLFSPLTIERFTSAIGSSSMSEEELFQNYAGTTESNAVRRMIWIVSAEVIKENPMGVGTGDVYPALEEKYQQRKMTGALERELNTHSQYLQTTIALGIPGLMVLLSALLLPLARAVRNNPLYVVFLLLTLLNIAVESMFEVQAGIVFFTFFNGICSRYNSAATNQSLNSES